MESVADLIRDGRGCLIDLRPLNLDPKLRNIYGTLAGDDLFIVNEFHRSKTFRKIHLEIAQLGSSLDILHCVFFPEPTFDLPIFGVDVVSNSEGISAAIVDLSPVGDSLPSEIESGLVDLTIPDFKNVRKIPQWGSIFSDYVQFIKPEDKIEEKEFLNLVRNYLDVLISNSLTGIPEPLESPLTIGRYQRQQLYCLQQKKNDKTRNVLAKTFSPQWADEYIDIVLFNCPTGYLDHLH